MHDYGWKADVVSSSTGSYPRRLESLLASLGKPYKFWKTLAHVCTEVTLQLISTPSREFPEFCGTRKLITAQGRARYLPLYWATSVQSTPSQPISIRSILILFDQRLGLPSGFFHSRVPLEPCMCLWSLPWMPHAPPNYCFWFVDTNNMGAVWAIGRMSVAAVSHLFN